MLPEWKPNEEKRRSNGKYEYREESIAEKRMADEKKNFEELRLIEESRIAEENRFLEEKKREIEKSLRKKTG